MTSQLQVVEETGVPGIKPPPNHHWLLSLMPRRGFEPVQWGETTSSQWQDFRPHDHQGRPMSKTFGRCCTDNACLAVNFIDTGTYYPYVAVGCSGFIALVNSTVFALLLQIS